METTCEGKIHIWAPGAKPGDNCACGAATWVQRPADVQKAAQGPTPVDEELKKGA